MKQAEIRSEKNSSTEAQNLEPWTNPTVVGKPLPRVDGYERVSGSAIYPADLILPDMLHAAVLRCPHPHAIVKNLNTEAVRKSPGVRAIVSSADPEGKLVVPYPWWVPEGPPVLLFDQHCRYQGEEVAAVAADTPYEAHDALRLIKVEYEDLPHLLPTGCSEAWATAPAQHREPGKTARYISTRRRRQGIRRSRCARRRNL